MWPRRGCAGGEASSGGGGCGLPETPFPECQTWRSRRGVGRGPQTLGAESILGAPSGAFLKSFPAGFCKARGSRRVATRLILFVNRASYRPG